ncbi:MAG TPA: histidine kinase [Acidimicrobiia bacterium]|nr:histidine kinase [Acidimicrobiia bacterium]
MNRRRILAWGMTLAVFTVAGTFLATSMGQFGQPFVAELAWLLLPCITALASLLILSSRPDNSIGWVLMAWAVGMVLSGVAPLPLVGFDEASELTILTWFLIWFAGVSWVLLIYPIFHLFMVFPTGRLPSKRWRWLLWLELGSLALFLALTVFSTNVEFDVLGILVPNPIGFIGDDFWSRWFPIPWTAILLLLTLGSASAAFFRYRQAAPEERMQIKWLLYAISVFVVVYAALAVGSDWELGAGVDVVFALSLAGIPVTIALAVVKFRLYDIDAVISRTLVYATLALFITGAYVGVVVGLGSLLGSDDAAPLPFVATVFVAVLFQPLRERLQKVADRVAYGRRATPYEALSAFSRRLSATDESLLDQAVRSLVDGTSARQAAVWVREGDMLVRSRVWPGDSADPETCPVGVEVIPGTDQTAWVTHEGRRLGALTLRFPRGQAATPTDERLLVELASGMGLALQNLTLTRSLHQRVDELRQSRRRIVSVQDETRRRLERDLHDGAQQQLVALKVKLSLAAKMATDSPRTAEVLSGLNAEAETAIQSMRALARGIYPPLLEAEGLGPAISALARGASVPVSVDLAGIGRHPTQIESTVYFCVAEALQHAIRHGRARSVHIWIRVEGNELAFTLRHDGVPAEGLSNGSINLADRLDSVRGRLDMDANGDGLTGRIALPERALR